MPNETLIISTGAERAETRVTTAPLRAAVWSQLHRRSGARPSSLNRTTTADAWPPAALRVAVLVTGELRFRDAAHLARVEAVLPRRDCFAVTYERFATLARRLAARCLFLGSADIAANHLEDRNLWQWCV